MTTTTNLTRQNLLDLIEETPGGVSLDYQTSNGARTTPFRLVNVEGDVLEAGNLDMTLAKEAEDGFENEFTEALFREFKKHLRSVTEYKSLVAGLLA